MEKFEIGEFVYFKDERTHFVVEVLEGEGYDEEVNFHGKVVWCADEYYEIGHDSYCWEYAQFKKFEKTY